MMSQPFARGFISPSPTRADEFMMMNNNHLPGINRMSNSSNFSFSPGSTVQPVVVSNTPLTPLVQPNINSESGATNMVGTITPQPFGLLDTVKSADSLMPDFSGQPELSAMDGSISASGMHNWPSSLCNTTQAQTSNVTFTFTTPTQSYLHSPPVTVTTKNRFMYSRATPHNFAPGCTAQWKHSLPRQVPWRCPKAEPASQGVPLFSGSNMSTNSAMLSSANMFGTNTYYSVQSNHPVPSCSEVVRRPKRRHTIDSVDDMSPETKVHLTEEKIANHMRELKINQLSPPLKLESKDFLDSASLSSLCTNFVDNGVELSGQGKKRFSEMPALGSECLSQNQVMCECGGSQSMICDQAKNGRTQSDKSEFLKHSERQWHDFKLLEEKLEMIDEDSETEEKSSTSPRLTIVEGINMTPSETLPRDIMEKIMNPCRDIVLWSPPDPPFRPPPETSDDAESSDSAVEPNMDMMDDGNAVNAGPIVSEVNVTDDSGMETESMDDIDL